MNVLNQLALASDAEQLAMFGLVCWGVAVICLIADRLREARRSPERLERVGFMRGRACLWGLRFWAGDVWR